MKTSILPLLFVLVAASANAQSKAPMKDIEAIKKMCGCYHITFDYAETFSPDTAYQFKDPYHAKARAEWVFVEEDTDDKIVLQHLLVINDTMVIKHWRQDWLFENTDLYEFYKDCQWNFTELPKKEVKGQWTQKVYQVDDSPRYEGSASWVHVDGKHYWENVTDAPLPRREFTKRSDYNVMQRTNRHMITDYGWVHEQDNLKLIREGKEDQLVAEEKGYNKYFSIEKEKCQTAIDWWEENADYWVLVRKAWDDVYAENRDLALAKKADDQLLYQALFAHGDQSVERAKTNPDAVLTEIAAIIAKYRQEPADRASR